jgi:hypothetical protein
MSYLNDYVADLNVMNKLFKRPALSINKAADRKAILENLECELSPENLCCDGELSGAPLRAKAKKLNGALAELEALNRTYGK